MKDELEHGTWIWSRLARRWADGAAGRLRFGLGVFAFFSGVLGIALAVAVLKPGVIRDPAQAAALRPYGLGLALLLWAGGVAAPWLARVRGVAAAIGAVSITTAALLLGLVLAAPEFQRAGTKELALVARARVPPGEARVIATAAGYFALTTTLDVRAGDAPDTELALAFG